VLLKLVPLRKLLIGGVVLAICLLATLGLGEFVRQYPLKQIKVIANFQQVSEPVLVQAIQQSLQKNMQRVRVSTLAEFVGRNGILDPHALPLMAIDVEAIRDDLAHFAWIDEIKLARRWPHTLEVTVQEQIPAAVFNNAYWVNSRGELYAPMVNDVKDESQSDLSSHSDNMYMNFSSVALQKIILPPQALVNAQLAEKLPHLSGPLDQAERIIRMYQQCAHLLRSARLSPFLDARQGVTKVENRLILRELQQTDQFGWILGLQQTATGQQNPLSFTVALDQDQPMKKLRRFIYFYDQLAERRTEIMSVDVRYVHGLAVEWRDQVAGVPAVAAVTLE
jgi:cell division septal protein FtsQ